MSRKEKLPTKEWSSEHTDWLNRSTPIEVAANELTKDELLFGASINAPVGTFPVLAVFKPDIAILSNGGAVKLKEEDVNAMVELTRKACNDFSERRWMLKQLITCRPHLRVHYPTEGTLEQVSVYGFQKTLFQLKGTNGFTELPDTIRELFGLMDEGKKAQSKVNGNEALKVKLSEVLEL